MMSHASQYKGTSSNSTNWFPTAPSAMAALEGHGIGAYNHLTSFPPAALGGVGWSEQTQQTEDYCPACPAPCVGSSPDPLVGCCGQCCGHGREEAGWDLFAGHWERAVRSWHLPEATRTKDVRRPVGSSLTRMMPLSRVTEPSVFAGGGFEAEFIGASHAKSPPSPAPAPPQPQPRLTTCSRQRNSGPRWVSKHPSTALAPRACRTHLLHCKHRLLGQQGLRQGGGRNRSIAHAGHCHQG